MTKKQPYTPQRKLLRTFADIAKDYTYDPSIFNEEPEKIRRAKQVIMLELNPVDRILFLMYLDCGSLRRLGEVFGVSYVTMHKEIKRIKDTIKTKL